MSNEYAVQMGSGTVMYGHYHDPDQKGHDHAFVFLNAGLLHRPGPFRLYTELARQLADIGMPVLRIDQAGKGDSDRRRGLDVSSSAKTDVEVIKVFLSERGINKMILAGLCSGADDALWIAQERDDIAGIVMLDGYCGLDLDYEFVRWKNRLAKVTPRWILGKVLSYSFFGKDQGSGASGEFENLRNFPDSERGQNMFRKLIEADTRCLCVFSGDVDHYYNHFGQLKNYVDSEGFDASIKEVFLSQAKHTYPFPAHRRQLQALILDWTRTNFRPEP